MKKIILLITLAAVGIVLGSCHMEKVRGSGNHVSEIIDVSPFDGIEANRGIKVYLDASARNDGTIEIVADDNLHKYIRSYVEDRELVVELPDHILIRGGTIKVYVDSDAISSLEGSGGARFECSGLLSSRSLDVELSGGSRFEGEVMVDHLDVDLSGGSVAEIEGECTRFELESSGGSIVRGYDLIAEDSSLDISGGSLVEQTVTRSLSVDASGGSKVRYKGNPELLRINTSGGSTVNAM